MCSSNTAASLTQKHLWDADSIFGIVFGILSSMIVVIYRMFGVLSGSLSDVKIWLQGSGFDIFTTLLEFFLDVLNLIYNEYPHPIG